ncbi:MAG: MFS transporter [Oscillospiraceae bacterium]|jgi:oligosaccharide:H+ symporter|nr:MFS transporter [Oscillospiraceae bacterium]
MLFLCFNTVFYLSSAAYNPFLSAHYASLGINTFRIGILISLGPLCSLFIVPIWSMLSDKSGNRTGVLKIATAGSMVTVLLFLFFKSFWTLFFVALLFLAFYTALIPLSDAITVSHLEKTDFKFSFVRMGGTVGFCVFSFFSGRIVALDGNFAFLMASFFLAILLILIFKMPKTEVKNREKVKIDFKRVFKNKTLIFILFMACVTQIALSCCGGFIGVFLREMGYGSKEIGMTMIVGSMSEIPVLLILDRILARVGAAPVLLFSGFVTALRTFLMAGADNLPSVLIAQIFHGMSYMAVYYSCVTFINNQMEDDLKSTGQSLLVFFQGGVGSILGNILGGYIADRIGMKSTYMIYGTLVLSVTVVSTLVILFMIIIKKRAKNRVS